MQTLSNNVRQYFHKRISELHINMTYEMVRVLILLNEHKYMNQQQIADLTFKNKASLTSLLNNMEKRNLVVRNEDQSDKRNKIITLTPTGKDLFSKVNPVFEEMYHLLYNDVSTEEVDLMNSIILKMNKSVE